ncbi:MAG TPA: hypothetical protein VHK06_04030, partial [Candidatus Limnocylindria bacterium]|nr:hypothetical protein [Candidatus Limnocylindria bacterium]
VAAGRDVYRYGFHRLSGQAPGPALDLALHGAERPMPHEADEAREPLDSAAAPLPAMPPGASADRPEPSREPAPVGRRREPARTAEVAEER